MIKDSAEEESEGIKGVIRIRKSKDRQHNGQKKRDKQRPTKHLHRKLRSSNTNPIKNRW